MLKTAKKGVYLALQLNYPSPSNHTPIGTQSEPTANWLAFLEPLKKKSLMYHPNLTVNRCTRSTKLLLKLGELVFTPLELNLLGSLS